MKMFKCDNADLIKITWIVYVLKCTNKYKFKKYYHITLKDKN